MANEYKLPVWRQQGTPGIDGKLDLEHRDLGEPGSNLRVNTAGDDLEWSEGGGTIVFGSINYDPSLVLSGLMHRGNAVAIGTGTVSISSSHDDNLGVVLAHAADDSHAAVGLAVNDATYNYPVTVQTNGPFTLDDWSATLDDESSYLVPGALYYLSTTPGKLSLTKPSTDSDIIQPVGRAIGSLTLLVEIDTPEEVAAVSDSGDTLSNAISVISQNLSVVSAAASNALSVANAASNAASNALSVANAASNAASNALSVANAASNAVSNETSNRISAQDVLSQQISVLSQQVSVLSAGLGVPQLQVLANNTTISATSFTNLSNIFVSMAANTTYGVEGIILHRQGAAQGILFGFTFPAAMAAGAIAMESFTALGPDATVARGVQEASAMSTVASNIISAQFTSAITYMTKVWGSMRTGANAGNAQFQARASATVNITFQPGCYLRAYKIG